MSRQFSPSDWMNAFGNIGGGLANLFGGGKNPADAAMGYYNQIPGAMGPYFNPYIQAGRQALGQLQGQYGQLINDPTQRLSQIGSHYQQSPGFGFEQQQGLNAITNAAAAGGMAGSPQHQQQAAQLASNLAAQDYGNYMNRALGLYQTGLSGEGDINRMGFGASTDYATDLANSLMNQGNLAYAGQINRNQQQGGWGNLLGGLAGAGAMYFGA